jgi:hypothetical protein
MARRGRAVIGLGAGGREVVGIACGRRAAVVARAPGGAAAVVPGLDGTVRDAAVRHPPDDDVAMLLEVVGRVVLASGALVDAAVVAVPTVADAGRRERVRAAAAEVGIELVAVLDARTAAARAWGGIGRPLLAELDADGLSVGVPGGELQRVAGGGEALAHALLDGLRARGQAVELAAALRGLESGGHELVDRDERILIGRDELERWLAPALAPLAETVARARRGAGEIDVVIPVGALWRLEPAATRLAAAAGAPVARERDPDHWVALGAALEAWRAVAAAADVSVASLVDRYRRRAQRS